ncbi:Cysteine-rich RLK (receptor-like protein kinase) 8 [Cucumis melo var. makuwa]|uniref:Cysteine-rich RLK (Receptor-like protein kinase) 8 n=1 Tax=Cucumis melo var. makuwa TaxID=1194695 RepID=A0A5D3BW06_CUCMM|nr:Cysteine-rich RLK (receptor-like protein kinase) 8 [Cucumis melo var. makuwa]TYK03255.1 Cysteine-rich RLK (receptor-like protein kinase) 8 [Cucumis melo var. makuwa]
MTTPESSTCGSSISSTPITSSKLDAQLNHFILHHSVIPTTNLVSTPRAGSRYYSSWSRAMKLGLSGKNKIGFITRVIEKPSEGSILFNLEV